MKKFLTVSFVFVGVLASTVSASAMALNATIYPPNVPAGEIVVTKFGSAQKVESHLNVVAYWKTSSAGQSFKMRLCAANDTTNKIQNQTTLNYVSPGSMSLAPTSYQLALWGGAELNSYTGSFKQTTVSGTWELPMTMREKTDISETE